MPTIDHIIKTTRSITMRARQVSAMYDAPISETETKRWTGSVPIEEKDWRIGLIVGPSGAGKSTVAKKLFPGLVDIDVTHETGSVIDDVSKDIPVTKIAETFGAVGFSTIPAWLRPYSVLSTGEKFRVDIAMRLLRPDSLVVVDEFTSVVDRQVAKIASHAVQKHVRRTEGRQFVAVTCHDDVEDWLQPDWVLNPSTMEFRWRCLRRRPSIDCEVRPVHYEAWKIFAPFHYMSSELSKAARCFCCFIENKPVAFAAMLHRPHMTAKNIKGISRLVTLPDYQGLGLAFALLESIGSGCRYLDLRLRMYPAHPSLVRSFQRSNQWRQDRKLGLKNEKTSTQNVNLGGRPCAVFEYIGKSDRDCARLLT